MAIWYILWRFGIFYGDLVYFMAIWYILWRFGIFFVHLIYVFCGHLVYVVVIWFILWSRFSVLSTLHHPVTTVFTAYAAH
jgi:hypothetical protein